MWARWNPPCEPPFGRFDALLGTQVTGISPLYRTAAWGMADGTPDFLNAVVELGTTMGSHELLAALQNIERTMGRIA